MTQDGDAIGNKGPKSLKCIVTSIHFNHQERNDFKWLKNSCQADTFVGQDGDGVIAVVRIKENGFISKFVLDPSLLCAFWDNEEIRLNCQHLFAQHKNGSIILYTIDDGGVTETIHLPQSKLASLIGYDQYGLASDTPLRLVECDQGLIALIVGCQHIACVQVGLTGALQMKCILPLPQSQAVSGAPALEENQIPTELACRIANGVLAIYDPNVEMIFLHSSQTGVCMCQINLQPLSLEPKCLDWRLSFDHSVIMLLNSQFCVSKINLHNHRSVTSGIVKWMNSEDNEKLHKHEHLKHCLFDFGDSVWRKETVTRHVKVSQARPGEDKIQKKLTGFKAAKSKKSLSKKGEADGDKTDLQSLELTEMKDEGWTVTALEVSSSVASIFLKREGMVVEKAICFANFSNNRVIVHRLPRASCIALSNSPSCFHLMWTDNSLAYIAPDTNLVKDDLISWMMAYSGPGVADALCQANQWTRTAIPLAALEASLQQRQLETLMFFFKSKQGLYSTWKQTLLPSLLQNEINGMESVLQLLSNLVLSGMADPQARIFARRILSLTLDFLYSLLEDAKECLDTLSCDPAVLEARKREIHDSCGVLLHHVSRLRKQMHQVGIKTTQSKINALSDPETLPKAVDLGPSTILEQFAKENRLSKLQAHLMKGDGDVKTYKQIITQLLEIVKKCLESKDLSSCQQILNNMGCEVSETLWSLSQFYSDRELQEFVTGQLTTAAFLTPEKRKVVEFMHQLYKAYPNESFSSAMKTKNNKSSWLWTNRDELLKNVISASNIFLPSYCGELSSQSPLNEADCPAELYASVLLAWLSDWSEDMKRSVLIEADFLTSEDKMSVLKMNSQGVWRFLASHNMLETLQLVVTKAAGNASAVQWPADPVADIQLGWSHLQKEILSLMLRLKKLDFSSCKSHDVDMQLLLRMVGGPLQQPHPLAYTGSSTLNQFHDIFINYCIKSGLQLPLWIYCRIHGIDVHKINTADEPTWFPQFQLFYSIPREPKDSASMLLASQMAAADLWSASPSCPMSVEAMLNEGQVMAALATLSYIKQDDISLSPEVVEKHLQQFPKLKSILLPDNQNSPNKPKMTVYQLLMGNVPFNIRRLFGWHSNNSFAGEDSPKIMPNFSEASLMGVVPSQQKLAYTYYLKQGRPMYAFLSFLVDELEKGDESISEKRIQPACGASLWVAVQNFSDSRITSACVVFVEMLGRASSLVRTMIHAGRILLSSKMKQINPNDEDAVRKEKKQVFVNEIVQQLQACVQSRRRYGPKLIASLQKEIMDEIQDEKMDSTSFEASQKWTLVNILCQLLSLPLSTVYLQACAKADNWLMFVWFAQLHQYPTTQLQGLLQAFQSIHYRDHLHYVLNNAESKLFSPSSVSSSSSSTFSYGAAAAAASNDRRSSNQRATLYSKIGVKKEMAYSSTDDEDKNKGPSPVPKSSFSSRLRHCEFHESEMPEAMAPDNVFRMLFHSQGMPCQWRCLLAAAVSLRNPLFAELAACCGCPAIPSVCGWLLASLTPSIKKDFLHQYGQLVSKWTLEKLELLIDVVMDSQLEDSLATVFDIMQPKSPLLPFFCFINECMARGHHAASKTYIDQFKDCMATFENQSSSEDVGSSLNGELPTIGDRAWVEKVVYQVILHVLKHMTSVYKAHRFLELLDKHNMSLVFRFDVLNFSLLHQVVRILYDNDVTGFHLVSLLTSGTASPLFEAECNKVVDFLIERNKFSQAMALVTMTGLKKEKVVLGQLKEEKQTLTKSGVWTAKHVRAQFWEKSCKMMAEFSCSFMACEHFFQAELEGTQFEYEKALLCQHWLSLLEDAEGPNTVCKRDDIFRTMWRHRIAAKMSLEEQEALDHIFDSTKVVEKQRYLKSDLVLAEMNTVEVSDVQEDLSSQELEILDSLMGDYLDNGQVNACARVASAFGHYSQDLAIIETCIALACGKNTRENIEPAMRRLVAKGTLKRRLSSVSKARSLSTVSLDSVSSNASDETVVPRKLQETFYMMEKLCEHCNKGQQVCLRIITCAKIAELLEMSYQEIVQAQEFDTLHQLLRAIHPDKFELAKEFLSTSGLLDDEVTKFLAELIVETLKAIVSRPEDTREDSDAGLTSVKPLLKSTDGMEVFVQFIKLSNNETLLGDQILQAVASLLSEDGNEMSSTVLTIQTEMIILAHKCYTSASNMEGISHVLRAARVCCNGLAQAGEFSLMIRLLTGVGRYSEMVYVFHALQQHHQFELLLRKGMDREDKLKVAILEYLKRYQPEDNESYTMVALKFSMFRDIAGLLENCGHRALRSIQTKTLENNKETQESLRKCLQYFQEAAESYVKDMSVRKAQKCIKMTRLISLQQQLLSHGVRVINLSREEVVAFASTHTRFIEAMVVTDAYEQKVNWRDAIFNNVLVGGEHRYMQEMKLHVHITSTLIEDVLQKYKNSNVKTSGSMAGVRKLLSHCKDAQLHYRLASELGLTDLVTAMLKGDTGNYLQDVTVV